MDDLQVIVVAHDGASAGQVMDLLAHTPGIEVEALVRTHPSVMLVTEMLSNHEGEWGRRLEKLSQRQREVLQELVDGKTIGPASEELFMSANTFRTHVKHVLSKLGAHSSLEAASIGVSGGMRPRRGPDPAEPTAPSGTTGSSGPPEDQSSR